MISLISIVLALVSSAWAHRKFVGDYRPGLSHMYYNLNDVPEFDMSAATLIFEDEFNTLDLKTWRHELTLGGGANWEFQQYSNNRSNSYVKDGVLYIHPTLTSETIGSDDAVMNNALLDIWGNMPGYKCTANAYYGCSRYSNGQNILNPIQSAQLRSHQKFSFKYGKVDVRARLPKGDWLWPAIWLLPIDHAYGGWPASGEIDLVESRGNSPDYAGGGHNSFFSTLHWGPDWSLNRYLLTSQTYTLPAGQSFSDSFHTFTLEWTPNYIVTRVDDIPVLYVPFKQSFWGLGQFPSNRANPWEDEPFSAPFNQDFYLIFNLAVGGTNGYFPESPGKPWSNKSPIAAKDFYLQKNQWLSTWAPGTGRDLAIDYVRVWGL